MKLLFKAIAILSILAIIAIGALFAYADQYYTAPGPLTENKTILIEPGTGFKTIAHRLEKEQIISDRWLYTGMVMLGKKQHLFKAGEYAFPSGITPSQVTDKLVSGDTVSHSITIPEGLVTRDILAIIGKDPLLTGEMPTDIKEGDLLPETYFYIRGDSRKKIIDRMRRDHQQWLTKLWKNRKPGLPLKTPEEAVILASIVEKETGIASERGRVAAVFINRLRLGMPLQSDPTTIYGLYHRDGELKQSLTRKDLESNTPYNTYVIPALPPGPIAHPGVASIKAVMNPPDTDELYFVADGSGGHVFAKTLAEHNRNVANYRAWLREQKRR